MKIALRRGIGLHRCAHCKSYLNDADYIDCGVLFAPQLALMFDYKCRVCERPGRYTMAATDADAGLEVALKFLAEIVVEVPKNRGNSSGA